jgi:hypothetical protein
MQLPVRPVVILRIRKLAGRKLQATTNQLFYVVIDYYVN